MWVKRLTGTALVVLCCLVLSIMPAAANGLAVAVDRSQVLTFNGVQRVAIANPNIADVVVVSGNEIILVGKKAGTTTLHIWTTAGRLSYQVEVAADDRFTAEALARLLNYPNVRVSKINDTVVLEGTVNDQSQKARAASLAAAYGQKVVNLLEVTQPTQVKIIATVLELNRSKAQKLGISWGNSIIVPGHFAFGQSITNSLVGQTLGDLGGYADINAELSLLVKTGAAKILSQPNVITLSGDKADIAIGGQIPVPVGLDNGRVTIEWKDYGIRLKIAPEVTASGLITSRVVAEVSTLDWNDEHQIELGAGMRIPPINMRKTETMVALPSGHTMAIGDLIAREVIKNVNKLPLLGDLPILGPLFRSKSFSTGETELLILITPMIVDSDEHQAGYSREMEGWRQGLGERRNADAGQDSSVDRR